MLAASLPISILYTQAAPWDRYIPQAEYMNIMAFHTYSVVYENITFSMHDSLLRHSLCCYLWQTLFVQVTNTALFVSQAI